MGYVFLTINNLINDCYPFKFFVVLSPNFIKSKVSALSITKLKAMGNMVLLLTMPMITETRAPKIILILPLSADARPMFFFTLSKDRAVVFGLTNPVVNKIRTKKEDRTASGGCVVLIIVRNKRLNTMVKKPAT